MHLTLNATSCAQPRLSLRSCRQRFVAVRRVRGRQIPVAEAAGVLLVVQTPVFVSSSAPLTCRPLHQAEAASGLGGARVGDPSGLATCLTAAA